MKYILAIGLILMLSATMVVVPSVLADQTTVTTDAEIVNSSQSGPVVKAKWELQVDAVPIDPTDWTQYFSCNPLNWYTSGSPTGGNGTGDADPIKSSTQIQPPKGSVGVGGALEEGESYVAYFAVIESGNMAFDDTDSNWPGVFLDVYDPEVKEYENLSTTQVDGMWCGSHKFQHNMFRLDKFLTDIVGCDFTEQQAAQIQADLYAQALGMSIVAHSTDPEWVYEGGCQTPECDVDYELVENLADIWVGFGTIHNHQPGIEWDGTSGGFWQMYLNTVSAYDVNDNPCNQPLDNYTEVLPVVSYAVDFTSINYGDVSIGQDNCVNGDGFPMTTALPMGTTLGLPTVWNNGNTYIKMLIAQDDMGFGKNDSTGDWDVSYMARVGSASTSGAMATYDPWCEKDGCILPDIPIGLMTEIPGSPLVMCTPTKMDFCINPVKDSGWVHVFSGQMLLDCEHIPYEACTR